MASAMQQLTLDVGLRTGPTLGNFVPGGNAALVEHLRLWLDDTQATPTYLWGESGVGKTHLLRAAQAHAEARGKSVGWLGADTLLPAAYDDRWGLVVLDEVHLYAPPQQHTAFSYFVQAQTMQVPVLAAGDAAPAHLALREDLRNRLGWGHVFEVHLLSESERREVLRHEMRERGLNVGEGVIDYMLLRFSRDLGSLMQLLDALDQYSLQTQRAITVPLLRSMLENL